ncbi:hypothetical protein PR048_031337 [Dryococelus australis]|uniref:Uncharacterized protein n=1 Tax=Dryococelus australis TaxID=614101 RepID=A0ABQ9G4Z3_9NEOP|nr:hypothetical protein PR048_031337 [Dryococelus australis]
MWDDIISAKNFVAHHSSSLIHNISTNDVERFNSVLTTLEATFWLLNTILKVNHKKKKIHKHLARSSPGSYFIKLKNVERRCLITSEISFALLNMKGITFRKIQFPNQIHICGWLNDPNSVTFRKKLQNEIVHTQGHNCHIHNLQKFSGEHGNQVIRKRTHCH